MPTAPKPQEPESSGETYGQAEALRDLKRAGLIETLAPNVIQALARVRRDLPGVGKNQKMSQPGAGNYDYRGIEDVTSAVGPLLGRHAVVFVPRVTDRQVQDIVVNGKPWTIDVLTVEYDAYGPDGTDDKITVGPFVGLARDNSDKGTNKAMTQAFKQMLVQVFAIGSNGDDPDSHPAQDRDLDAERAQREAVEAEEARRQMRAAHDAKAQEAGWQTAEQARMTQTELSDLVRSFEPARRLVYLDRIAEKDLDAAPNPDGFVKGKKAHDARQALIIAHEVASAVVQSGETPATPAATQESP